MIKWKNVNLGYIWIGLKTQCVCVCIFPFFFSRIFETCGYCLCTVQWIVATKFDFSHFFQPISAHRVMFTDPQISLLNNFFIKNGSHGTIHTFKNYFATVFFNFQFQFSVFSCIQTDSKQWCTTCHFANYVLQESEQHQPTSR